MRVRTNLFNSSFFPSTIQLWNELSISSWNADNLEEFRAELNRAAHANETDKLFYIGDTVD